MQALICRDDRYRARRRRDRGGASSAGKAEFWFEEIGLKDADRVGGKGADLGDLTAGGLPVLSGFVITGEAYLDAVDGPVCVIVW